MKKEFDYLSNEKRNDAIKGVIAFFQDERGEEIGMIAAGELLDFFLQTVGEDVYSKAVHDIKKIARERLADLETELDLLGRK